MDSRDKPKAVAMPQGLLAVLVAIMVLLAALCTYLACVNVAGPANATAGGASETGETNDAQGQSQSDASESSKYPMGTLMEYEPLAPANDDGIKMPFTYSTAMGAVTLVTYPSFSFSFPDTWSIEREVVERGLEEVTLQRKSTDIAVNYSYGLDAPNPAHVNLVTIKKVADSAFWPGYVQSNDHTGLGPFMVAEVVLSKTTADGAPYEFTYYAVVPESALKRPDSPGLDIASGVPSFRYSGTIAFWSLVPDGGITDDQRRELIAVLSSFTNGMTEEDYWKCVEASATFEG